MSEYRDYLEERRVKLHNDLKAALGSDNVYFQPPETLEIKYPAIIYERYGINAAHASNKVYARSFDFLVIVVSKHPCESVVDKLSEFPTARYSRHYVHDGLHHDSFIIKY